MNKGQKDAINDAIGFAGSQGKLADLIGRSQQQISKWLRDPTAHISLEDALDVEKQTGVSLGRTRPDALVRWPRLRANDGHGLPFRPVTG